MPTVTVLMPVYNGEKYLKESIESILTQTYTDFEFLIINDGSTDSSKFIVSSYNDTRIRYIEKEKNTGIVDTLNYGLDLASGKYIARMDCDDISLPVRLEKQVIFMDNNPDVGISGTWAQTFGELSNNDVWKYPESHKDISCALMFNSVLVHSSVIMRKSYLQQYKLTYKTDYIYAEDYDFWVNANACFKLANIPKVLLKYRISYNSTSHSSKNSENKLESTRKVRINCFKKYSINLTAEQIDLFSLICSYEKLKETNLFYNAIDVLNSIYSQSIQKTVFDNKTISKPIFNYYYFLLHNIPQVDLLTIKKYMLSEAFLKNTLKLKYLKLLLHLVKKSLWKAK